MDYSASKYRDFYRPHTDRSPRDQRANLDFHQRHDYRPASPRISSEIRASTILPALPAGEAYHVTASVGPMQRIYSDESPPNSTGPSTLTQPLDTLSRPLKRGPETFLFGTDSDKRPRFLRPAEFETTQWNSAMTGASGMHRQVPQLGITVPSGCTFSKHAAYPPHRTSSIHKYPAQIYPPPQSTFTLMSPLLDQTLSPFRDVNADDNERRASSQRLPSIRSPQVLGDHFAHCIHPTTYATTPGSRSGYELQISNTSFGNPWQASPRSCRATSPGANQGVSPRHISSEAPRYVPVTSSEYVQNTYSAHNLNALYNSSMTSSGSSGETRPPQPAKQPDTIWAPHSIPRPGPDSIPRMLSGTRRAEKDRILNTARQLASLPTPGEHFEGKERRVKTIPCLYSFSGTCETAFGDEGRTVIMHLVGRNKTEATALKTRDFIERSCRRHYQRIRYHTLGMNSNPRPENSYYPVIQGILLERIWDRVDQEDPHAKWQICLTKSAGDHYRIEKRRMQATARGENPDAVAPRREAVPEGQTQNEKVQTNRLWARALLKDDVFEQRILSKHYLDNTAPKDYKTTAECRGALHWLLDILAIARGGHDYVGLETINELPEIEFLWKAPANLQPREG